MFTGLPELYEYFDLIINFIDYIFYKKYLNLIVFFFLFLFYFYVFLLNYKVNSWILNVQSCQKRKIIMRQIIFLSISLCTFIYVLRKRWTKDYQICHKTKYLELNLKLWNVLFSKSMFSINDWTTKKCQTLFYLPNLLSQVLNWEKIICTSQIPNKSYHFVGEISCFKMVWKKLSFTG